MSSTRCASGKTSISPTNNSLGSWSPYEWGKESVDDVVSGHCYDRRWGIFFGSVEADAGLPNPRQGS